MIQLTETTITQVPLNLIDPDPDNREIDQSNVNDIAATIPVHGIRQAIKLRAHPETEGRFMIVHGEHRWRAGIKAECDDTIPAMKATQQEIENHLTRITMMALDNISKPLSQLDYGRMYAKFKNDCGMSSSDIEKHMESNGMKKHSASAIRNLIRIHEQSPDWLKGMIKKDSLTTRQARDLLNLSPEIQRETKAWLNTNPRPNGDALNGKILELYRERHPMLSDDQLDVESCAGCAHKKTISKQTFCLDSHCHTAKRAEWADLKQEMGKPGDIEEEEEEDEVQVTQWEGAEDPLYGEACAIVATLANPTISTLQRQLKIGYNRAAHLMETMQQQGIVSEPDTDGTRSVITTTTTETIEPVEHNEQQEDMFDEYRELEPPRFDQSDCKQCPNRVSISGEGERNCCDDVDCYQSKAHQAHDAYGEVCRWIVDTSKSRLDEGAAKIVVLWAALHNPVNVKHEVCPACVLDEIDEEEAIEWTEKNAQQGISEIIPDASTFIDIASMYLTRIGYHISSPDGKKALTDLAKLFEITIDQYRINKEWLANQQPEEIRATIQWAIQAKEFDTKEFWQSLMKDCPDHKLDETGTSMAPVIGPPLDIQWAWKQITGDTQ